MIRNPYFLDINSQNRVSGTDGNFFYNINLPTNEGHKYNRVVVTECSIPKSYYMVQAGFNTFILREGASSVTVTITPGNYTLQAFNTNIAALINAASPTHWT
jgi:hypothetical protein